MIAPRGSANSLNLSSKGSTSCNATIALQSSTYARIKPRVPFLSSPLSPSLSRCDPRTMAAKIGEKGHPCEKPSVTGLLRRSTKGESEGETLAKRGVNCLRSDIAVIRRIANGILSGRSFVLSSWSFSRTTRYVNCVTSDGLMFGCGVAALLDEFPYGDVLKVRVGGKY
eukprot:scaffold161736_cov98-Cyclotella_meneghiniana.AAC.2